MALINKKKFGAALRTPFVSSKDGVKALNEAYKKKDSATIAQKLNEVLSLMHAAQHDHAFGEKAITMIGSYNGASAGEYMDFVDELAVDLNWMRFFKMVDASGTNRAEIFDFNSVVTWDQYEDGEKIDFKPLGSETYAELRANRYGVGVQMLRRWLSANEMYNINDALEAIRQANITEKADFGYTQLFSTAGVTTETFATSIVNTLNLAADDLLQGVAGSGFNISADTPLLLLCNGQHRAAVNAALETVRDMGQGAETVVEYNITPVYTYNTNVTAQIAATNAGMLILPGYKNVWATFDPIAINQEMDFSTDSLKIEAQEYWNAQAVVAQKRIVEFA